MKNNLKINRYLLIPAMIPVMLILWKLVLSADRLHAWKYSDDFDPPSQSDVIFAAVVYFSSLLTPVWIGVIAAIIAHRKKCSARWPVLETVIVVSVYLIIGVISQNIVNPTMEVIAIAGASCFMGGIIVTALINLAACIRQRKWVKLIHSAMVFIGGELYLLWLYAFIIYIDT